MLFIKLNQNMISIVNNLQCCKRNSKEKVTKLEFWTKSNNKIYLSYKKKTQEKNK